jgi:hypothetical protein
MRTAPSLGRCHNQEASLLKTPKRNRRLWFKGELSIESIYSYYLNTVINPEICSNFKTNEEK